MEIRCSDKLDFLMNNERMTRVKPLVNTLVQASLQGHMRWDRNLLNSINAAIAVIDKKLSQQLSAIMQIEKFAQLEGSWLGLEHLVKNTDSHAGLKIKVLNVSQRELQKDFNRSSEFDQSYLFKQIYEKEFGTPGGEPYAALIGDYQFSHLPTDIDLLSNIASVASSAFCPFISASSPELFGFTSWAELSRPRDLAKIFDTAEYTQWRHFRETDDARFITLTLPRVLARLPYGPTTQPVDAFNYQELVNGRHDFCWMSASYVMATRLTAAFNEYGWCTAIRGAEGGGCVHKLPVYHFRSDEGDLNTQCPTEVAITDRREMELSKLGLLPLCHYKNTDYAVFFGAQSLHKQKKYPSAEANKNAEIANRLPYIMATSRFAHYLKVMARDKVGAFMQAQEVEAWLNQWILNYVNNNADSGHAMKAKYPLAEAKIEVVEAVGCPGSYRAVAWLKPWLQLEELTASMRLVANIPKQSTAGY